jgi:hypothetical protein
MIYLTESIYHQLQADYSGICLKCFTVRRGDTEPDARNYPCDACETNFVYGISELIIRGIVNFIDEGEEPYATNRNGERKEFKI